MRTVRKVVGARALVAGLTLAATMLVATMLATTVGGRVGAAAAAPSAVQSGYWLVGSDGAVFSFGGVTFAGSLGGTPLGAPIVGMAATPSGGGYWLASADGRVFGFGDAPVLGSPADLQASARPTSPVVAIAATTTGGGYWVATAAGGVYAFGDANFYGSAAGPSLPSRIVTMAATPNGGGYWLTSAAGGVYAYGNAPFAGAAATLPLVRPIVSMAPTRSGRGYWLTAGDGGVFSYGDAAFYGSTGGIRLNQPIVGMTASLNGRGYWFVAADGGVFSFGDAPFRGSTGNRHLGAPIVAMSVGHTAVPYVPGQNGYDVSFPQCGGPLPGGGAFGIVGVNDGRAFTHDPCLATLASWAGPTQSAYINLNAPPPGSAQALNGPAGQCAGNDTGCMAYNYGYNAAVDAYRYGTSQGVNAGVWWLDIETSNTWDSNKFNNSRTIQAALDALNASGALAGIYSTSYQWGIIAGGFAPRVPEWVPTGADFQTAVKYCDGTHSFGAGGIPWITQYGTAGNPYDQDYVCPQS